MSRTATGPLTGVRILDLSTVLTGPVATSMLADQGADVVKVEAPGRGDITRITGSSHNGVSAMYHLANRGKRGIVVDLSTATGRDVLLRLVETADVFVQNFRPGVVERMGIGYDALRSVRPDIVYLSISGFGAEGPLSQLRVYDNIVQAVSGMAMMQGGGGEPVYVRTLASDKITALTAAQAVTAALFARGRGAGGQHIDLAMFDATVAFLWPDTGAGCAMLDDDAGVLVSNRGYEMAAHRDGWTACAPVSDAEFQGWCRAFGAPDVADDPRFATTAQRLSQSDFPAVRRKVMAGASALTVSAALARLREEGVDAVEVVTLDRLAQHPQAITNATFVVQDHPTAGPIREVAPAARFSATPSAPGPPAPFAGQHTDEVLGEAGFTLQEIAALRRAGAVG